MTNMSGDMAETSVTDFFLPELGRMSGSTNPTMPQNSKVVGSWPMDRVEIDAYDNRHRLIWPTYTYRTKYVKQIRPN